MVRTAVADCLKRFFDDGADGRSVCKMCRKTMDPKLQRRHLKKEHPQQNAEVDVEVQRLRDLNSNRHVLPVDNAENGQNPQYVEVEKADSKDIAAALVYFFEKADGRPRCRRCGHQITCSRERHLVHCSQKNYNAFLEIVYKGGQIDALETEGPIAPHGYNSQEPARAATEPSTSAATPIHRLSESLVAGVAALETESPTNDHNVQEPSQTEESTSTAPTASQTASPSAAPIRLLSEPPTTSSAAPTAPQPTSVPTVTPNHLVSDGLIGGAAARGVVAEASGTIQTIAQRGRQIDALASDRIAPNALNSQEPARVPIEESTPAASTASQPISVPTATPNQPFNDGLIGAIVGGGGNNIFLYPNFFFIQPNVQRAQRTATAATQTNPLNDGLVGGAATATAERSDSRGSAAGVSIQPNAQRGHQIEDSLPVEDPIAANALNFQEPARVPTEQSTTAAPMASRPTSVPPATPSFHPPVVSDGLVSGAAAIAAGRSDSRGLAAGVSGTLQPNAQRVETVAAPVQTVQPNAQRVDTATQTERFSDRVRPVVVVHPTVRDDGRRPPSPPNSDGADTRTDLEDSNPTALNFDFFGRSDD